jgi:hypothetical protein
MRQIYKQKEYFYTRVKTLQNSALKLLVISTGKAAVRVIERKEYSTLSNIVHTGTTSNVHLARGKANLPLRKILLVQHPAGKGVMSVVPSRS